MLAIDQSKIARGLIAREFFTSAALFEDEQCRLAAQTWVFAAHRSEFKRPGDFKTTRLFGQPALIILGDDERVRVFLNSCRHRGTLVELEEQGNRQQFRCLYHHWEYDSRGALTLVPLEEGYGPHFAKRDHSLVEFPHVDTAFGLVFAAISREVPPLAQYLGDALPYLEFLETCAGPLEALGCYDFLYEGNWKMLYENTLDDYHAQYLHAEAYKQPDYATGQAYAAQGSSADKSNDSPSRDPRAVGIHSVLDWLDAANTLKIQTERRRHLHVAIFPSFLGLYHPGWDVFNYRILRPESVGRTRVHNYVLGPASLGAEEKRKLAERFHYSYGPGGRVGLDDVRVFKYMQEGLVAQAGDVLVTRGLHREVGGAADEHNIRAFWEAWGQMMNRPEGTAK